MCAQYHPTLMRFCDSKILQVTFWPTVSLSVREFRRDLRGSSRGIKGEDMDITEEWGTSRRTSRGTPKGTSEGTSDGGL